MTADTMASKVVGKLRQSSLLTLAYDWINAIQYELESLCYWVCLESTPPHQFALAAPYTTGTVDVTNGSKAVVGSGTAWTSGHVNQVIQFQGDDTYYWISAAGSATGLTLATEYIGTTASGLTYAIYTVTYAVPATASPGKIKSVVLQDSHRKLARLDQGERDEVFPNLLRSIAEPTHYCDWGGAEIQVIPPTDAQYLAVMRFQKYPAEVSAIQTTLDWPVNMHPCIQQGAEAIGWDYLDDSKAPMERARFLELASRHVTRNNARVDNSPFLRSFLEGATRGRIVPSWGPRVNGSGSVE